MTRVIPHPPSTIRDAIGREPVTFPMAVACPRCGSGTGMELTEQAQKATRRANACYGCLLLTEDSWVPERVT